MSKTKVSPYTQYIESLDYANQIGYTYALRFLYQNRAFGWRDFGSEALKELDGMGLYERDGHYVFITRAGVELYAALKEYLGWR